MVALWLAAVAFAQGPEGQHGAPAALLRDFFVPMLLVAVVIYFILYRPERQRQRAHQEMLGNLKRNDEVLMNGGLYGRVVALGDKVLTLEIAPNVRVRVERAQVASVLRPARNEATPTKGARKERS